MKFNVEVEIGWIEDELDDAFRDKLLERLTQKIMSEFTEHAGKRVAIEAEAIIRAKTELLIATVLEKPVVVSDGWNAKKEYDSIFAMVEQRMTALYKGKLDASGKCEKDPFLARVEAFVKQETESTLKKIEQSIRTIAAEESKKAVNDSGLLKAIGLVLEKGTGK